MRDDRSLIGLTCTRGLHTFARRKLWYLPNLADRVRKVAVALAQSSFGRANNPLKIGWPGRSIAATNVAYASHPGTASLGERPSVWSPQTKLPEAGDVEKWADCCVSALATGDD